MKFAFEEAARLTRFAGAANGIQLFSRYHATEYEARSKALTKALSTVSTLVRGAVPGADLHARVKSLRSTWSKLCRVRSEHGRVLDSLGVRIVVPSIPDCYRAYGQIRHAFETVEGEDDDYIARPKPNGYRSLHTTIVGPWGRPVEIQVRTRSMHVVAEAGSAAHRRYKQLCELRTWSGSSRAPSI